MSQEPGSVLPARASAKEATEAKEAKEVQEEVKAEVKTAAKNDTSDPNLQDPETLDLINWTIFLELLMMDEDEENFSKSLIETFFEQFDQKYDENVKLLAQPDAGLDLVLKEISDNGHYLKGSAAALGLVWIQAECERIQNYGNKSNFDDMVVGDDWVEGVRDALGKAKAECDKAKVLFGNYYGEEL